MSDFLLSRRTDCSSRIGEVLRTLTSVAEADVRRFDGPWGSLAVSKNLHHGYEPYETDAAIVVVVGGPLPKVAFVEGGKIDDSNRGTATIAKRFFEERAADWHFDLLAPCCFLHVDKQTHVVSVVTDEMSFIPAYVAFAQGDRGNEILALSTHPDAAALSASGDGSPSIDPVSACDLIMNCVVTYPHTLHTNVRELAPASIHRLERASIQSDPYWRPVEQSPKYQRLRDTAHEAREALLEVVSRAAEYYGRLGLLISAGEDSRTLACMAPPETPMHCFAVAPSDNRELQIARRVALALGAQFESVPLPASNYLRDMGRRGLFAGSSCVSAYAHLKGVLDKTAVSEQPVVLGGYKGDVFLKGYYRRARYIMPGVPYQRFDPRPRSAPSRQKFFPEDLLAEVEARKRRHRDWVREYLPETWNCWFMQMPMSQGSPIAHYWSNRRTLPVIEPFMTGRILDVAIGVPAKWLLNRRLYYAMAAPYLRRLWWIPHGRGHFPAFPWYVNFPILPAVRAYLKMRYGRTSGPQGAWPALDDALLSSDGVELAQRLLPRVNELDVGLSEDTPLFLDTTLPSSQRYAFLQLLSMLEQFDRLGQAVLRDEADRRKVC